MKFIVTSPTSQFDLSNTKEVRVVLVKIISTIIQQIGPWSQEEVAEVLKIDQPKVSGLKHLKVSGFSLERILLFLLRLNCDINLVINIPGNIATIKVQSDIQNVRIGVMKCITSIIAQYQLTQVAAAKIMLVGQPTISKIRNMKTDKLAVERLLNLLARINCNIEIIVKEQEF